MALDVLGAVATLGSSLIGAGSSAVSGAMSYQSARQLQQQQAKLNYNYTRKLNQNAYQDTMKSMRASGLNPMLAYQNGINGLSSSVSGASASIPDLGSTLNSAMSNRIASRQQKSQEQLNNSAVDLNKASERKVIYEGDLAHENSAYINQQNRILNEFGSAKAGAEVMQILNSIKNQNRMTDAQINALSFQNAFSRANTAKALNDLKVTPQVKKFDLNVFGRRAFGVERNNYNY